MGNAIIERVGGVGVDCDDATATTSQVLSGYTFGGSASDEIQTGAMTNRGTTNYSITTNGGSVTIGQGYHSGSGKVTYTLPSVAGGTTYTPTAAAQTVSLTNKYLKSNISVAGSSNLVAGNILSGKSIWGVSGSFVNIANVSTVYNGSNFYGFLSSGVLSNPTAGGGAIGTYWLPWSGTSNTNAAIRSGSLYIADNNSPFSSTYYSRFVSAKSINFSLFSTIRFTGYFSTSVTLFSREEAGVSMTMQIVERTNNSGTTAAVATLSNVLGRFYVTHDDADDPGYYAATINFDSSFSISSWSETAAFLDVGVKASNRDTGSYIRWGGVESLYITGIYLS